MLLLTVSTASWAEPPPIVLSPSPAGILVTCSDRKALDEFEALLQAVAANLVPGRELTFFHLKSASAADVAATLASLVPSRVVPDARLNALIVDAEPHDLVTIEQLVGILDREELQETNVAPRPRLIQVKFTRAAVLAESIKAVYQNRLVGGDSGRNDSQSAADFFRLLQEGGRGENPSPRRGQAQEVRDLAVAADERTNCLIVSAPQPLFREIEQFVATLDRQTSEATKSLSVITLKRSNAAAVQKALQAITGVSTTALEPASATPRAAGGLGGRSDGAAGSRTGAPLEGVPDRAGGRDEQRGASRIRGESGSGNRRTGEQDAAPSSGGRDP